VGKSAKKTWRANYTTVRKNMKRRGMLKLCNRCGYSAMPEILDVHHRDRDRTNNEPENLEVLCPNCHAIEHRINLIKILG
jgi:5-methylcytosine-specific restriction endonuclease McrA